MSAFPILSVVVFVLAALLGCAERPAVQGESVVEPVVRLVNELDPPEPEWMPRRCAVDDEFRPSIGCMPVLMERAELEADESADRIKMVGDTPTGQAGADVVVEPTIRFDTDSRVMRLPPEILLEAPRTIEMRLSPGAGRLRPKSVGQLAVRGLHPTHTRASTRPIRIPENAELRVGLALDPVATNLSKGPTKFVVRADSADGQREILSERVETDAAGVWHDRRIDLAPLAGRDVRFWFFTDSPSVEGNPDAAVAFPVWGAPEIVAPRRRAGRRNIVLISLDTVRADHLGGEIGGARLTPWFDELVREGTIFREAVSTFNATSASHMSLFTGVYPVTHRVRHAVHVLPENIATLPELLSDAGYATGAVTENAMILAGSGFARGFDSYRENKDGRRHTGAIDDTFGAGVSWLERHRGELLFLFLHTYEAHAPYEPKEEVLETLPQADASARSRLDKVRRAYAAEVRYADQRLRHLFEELRRLDLLNDTLVVITSDHGEEFGEHGQVGHAKTVYDEVLRVPLLFWEPGRVPAGRVVDELVSLVDVAPTILDLAGIQPPAGIRGLSLVPAFGDAPLGTGVRYAEGVDGRQRLVVARTKTHKWIWHEGGAIEVYDLTADPGEQAPVGAPELQARGEALLHAYLDKEATARNAASGNGGPEERVLDEATRQKLEALGYVE